MERYLYKKAPDYYSNPHLLGEASGRSWAGFIGSLVRRELVSAADVGSDGFFKAESLCKVLYFQNNPQLLAAVCARQLSDRSTLRRKAMILEKSVLEEPKEEPEILEFSWPFAESLRAWRIPRWLAPAGLFTAGVILGVSLSFLKPKPVSAQTPVPTPTPKTELTPTRTSTPLPTRTPTRVPPTPSVTPKPTETPSPTSSPTPEPTPASPVLDELTKKRAEAVAVQLPNFEDLIEDAVRISAEQLEVSVADLDPATLRAVNIRAKNIIEGVSNLVINGSTQSDELFELVLNSQLIRNQIRVTIFNHIKDGLEEAEFTQQINRADITISLLKKATNNDQSLQNGIIYLMSKGFTAEDLDYAVTKAEKWGRIKKLTGSILVALFSEYNQLVKPGDTLGGRWSILRALENKYLEVLETETIFLANLDGLKMNLASQ